MKASDILEDQVIHVKRGRSVGLGFEPAFNSYFDFYLNTRYFGQSLLQLEDVTFHLFLRKNLNDHNSRWKMPTIRQMKQRFGVGQTKIDAMLTRLAQAHLLKKQSGLERRVDGKTARNNYILSDPIPTLEEFLTVAAEGILGLQLLPEYQPMPEISRTQNGYEHVPKMGTSHVPEMGTDQQTLNTQQTDDSFEYKLWGNVMLSLKQSITSASFNAFLEETKLQSLEDGVATITTPRTHAVEWIENRLGNQIRKLIQTELRMAGQNATKIETVKCVVA